jgi:hypothetical protein
VLQIHVLVHEPVAQLRVLVERSPQFGFRARARERAGEDLRDEREPIDDRLGPRVFAP